jgi:hypothetical protein
MGKTRMQVGPRQGAENTPPGRCCGSQVSTQEPAHSMSLKEQRYQPVTLQNPPRSITTPMSRPSASHGRSN